MEEANKVHVRMVTETNVNDVPERANNNWKKRLLGFYGKMKRFPGLLWRNISKIGRDDPRRIIHALKVGLSLTLVSLLYLTKPLFNFHDIGRNEIWAVMTVVLVLEFTAGATLCKGLNRGVGTFLAGSLAFLIEYITSNSSKVFRSVFIGVAVFLIGTASTYARFVPYIKKNYDYGVLIFLLTFNMITVSSYRDVNVNVFKMAQDRFYTIAIGCAICLLMSLLVFPIWSGEDLHNSTVAKLEGLATSIQACVNEYFNDSEIEENEDRLSEDPIYEGYKAVLDSKSTDETLALYASWEPWHSRHCYRFPWKQYVKLGAVLRQFGYRVVALHGCLQTEIQTPRSVRALFKDPCTRLAREVTKVLTELAVSIKNRRHCSPEILSDHLHEALQDLNTALKMQSFDSSECRTKRLGENERKVLRPQVSKIKITSLELSEALPFAAFASLLVEIVARLDNVIEEVEELGRIGCYKEYDPEDDKIVLKCEVPPPVDITKNQMPRHTTE